MIAVSIVIPVRNESTTLDELFDGLAALSPSPTEVVFVDTGSIDHSPQLIEQGLTRLGRKGIRGRLCHLSNAYPGAARNAGIAEASEEWVAFLDAGIVPHPDWLGKLWQCHLSRGSLAVFGCCRFGSDSGLGRMLCAASYGVGQVAPVLPASLFHRSLFNNVGLFNEGLRAGEDILWKQALREANITITICKQAIVEYKHFSLTLSGAICKQFIYEQNAVAAGVGSVARSVMLGSLLMTYGAAFLLLPQAFVLLAFYLLIRGLIDPVFRSPNRVWWNAPWQVAALPVVVSLLDFSAALGRFTAMVGFTSFRQQMSGKN